MKIVLYISAFLLAVSVWSQPNKYIGEKNGKFGILDNREEYFMIKAQFDEAHALMHGYFQGGYVGRIGDVWYYYDYDYNLVKDSLEFDEFLGNTHYSYNWVLKNDTVFIYNFEDHSFELISEHSDVYPKDQLIFFQDSDDEWGAIWPDGRLMIRPIWKEFYSPMQYQLKLQIPILFTNRNNAGGAFYDNQGNLILEFDDTLDYLGNQKTPFIRLYKNKADLNNRKIALGMINVKEKKLELLTEYDYKYLIINYQKTPDGISIARGFTADSTQILIYPDGSTYTVNYKPPEDK